ncbi:unnamed protein product [Periconia digitata]|uniref:F-box domain-containing protein n=1 Tax=Periconia digitata TaxID=1303443 RepID=A0A9W4UK98_9PLEO|nr:unnamed protein product [Periconia digitata]
MPSVDLAHDLPEEVLANVVSQCERGSLLALCQCSKTLNRLATPYLYSHIRLRKQWSRFGVSAHLLPLTWLLLTSAPHAECVQSLAVQVGKNDCPPVEHFGNDVTAPEGYSPKKPWGVPDGKRLEMRLRGACGEHTKSEEDANELYELIKGGEKEGAIVILLLTRLHNLRTFDFCECIGSCDAMVRALELVSGGSWGRLGGDIDPSTSVDDKTTVSRKSLAIMVSGIEVKLPNNLRHVPAFLKIPTIQSLYAWKPGEFRDVGEEPRDNPFYRLQERSCRTEYVELRRAKLYHTHFDKLMKAFIPGTLKTLVYEVGCTWVCVVVSHPRILKSLRPHYQTLERLELSHEDRYHQFDDDTDHLWPIQFTSFTNLKKLKVAPVYIWGVDGTTMEWKIKDPSLIGMLRDALPPTLDELWITRVNTHGYHPEYISAVLIPALYSLVEHRESFPLLKNLYIAFNSNMGELDWLNDIHAFATFARCYGITLRAKLTDKVGLERGWGWDESVQWETCNQNSGNNFPLIVVAEEKDMHETLMNLGAKVKDRDREDIYHPSVLLIPHVSRCRPTLISNSLLP